MTEEREVCGMTEEQMEIVQKVSALVHENVRLKQENAQLKEELLRMRVSETRRALEAKKQRKRTWWLFG